MRCARCGEPVLWPKDYLKVAGELQQQLGYKAMIWRMYMHGRELIKRQLRGEATTREMVDFLKWWYIDEETGDLTWTI